jgi:hypothetical protein
VKDFKQNGLGDILLDEGDLHYTEPTRQHQRDIMLTRKGEIKHSPNTGCGIEDFIDEERPDEMLREIHAQFVRDGMVITQIRHSQNTINIEASYARN